LPQDRRGEGGVDGAAGGVEHSLPAGRGRLGFDPGGEAAAISSLAQVG
jgi:hypothetical protein